MSLKAERHDELARLRATPPAASQAMREAEALVDGICAKLGYGTRLVSLRWAVASEIARLQAEIIYLSGDRDDAREGERRWALRCGTVLGETPEHDAPAEPGRLGFITMSGRHDQSAWDGLTPEARQRWSYVEGAYLMRADAEIARLTRERDAASDDAGAWEALCGSALERLRAAEAETARRRAERLILDKRIHNQRVALRQNWEITEMRNKDHHRAAVRTRLLAICCRLRAELNAARAALTSQEKTDA